MIPVALDAYLQWDRLPYQRIGERAYMRSTYDRQGGNEGADASHFLYQQSDSFNVALDVKGAGILYFARYNHWHGSPWHYEVDGVDHIVEESSSGNPDAPAANSVFLPQAAFPNPLTWTWSLTKGADLEWVPVPFQQSFRMAFARTHYGTGYFIYHLFANPELLSQPIHPFDFVTPPDKAVLDLIDRSGTDIAPIPGTAQGNLAQVAEQSGGLSLAAHDSVTLFQMSDKPSVIRALKISVDKSKAIAFGHVFIRITWDQRAHPSVDAPLNLFHGAGSFYNRTGKECLVKAFPVSVCFDSTRLNLASYFPMPFFKSCRIDLINRDSVSFSDVKWSVRTQPFQDAANQSAYFHASYRDHGAGIPGQDLVFLDTRNMEDSKDWSGNFVGTSFIFSTEGNLGTLEGDPRFFFDDSRSPQAYGTGTEEWGGGGDYWGGQDMTIPFAGHPVGAQAPAQNAEDRINSAYRFLIADCMPFGNSARIQFEHGGTDDLAEHYSSVTFWYGLPAASLILTDSLDIGNAASEQKHFYGSPTASPVYSLTSAYDGLGPNAVAGKDSGRTMTGTSTFKVLLASDNYGVMLRRKLDYGFPNQNARVSMSGDTAAGWQSVGAWYCAGSNTDVYSNPSTELGATVHTVQTSNRRFREDEFLIPQSLTRGKQEIWVQVRYLPDSTPLFPGIPFPNPSKWSEMQYKAYCWVMPDFSGPTNVNAVGTIIPGGNGFELKAAQDQSGAILIEFRIPEGQRVKISVFNLKGELSAPLVNGMMPRGMHRILWRASRREHGTFLITFTAGNRIVDKRKIVLQ